MVFMFLCKLPSGVASIIINFEYQKDFFHMDMDPLLIVVH
jgi:hypothetical protein